MSATEPVRIKKIRPEDDVVENGMPALPQFLKNDQDAIVALECVKDLLDRFNLINVKEQKLILLNQTLSNDRRKSLHNETRRQIGPALALAMTYLYERAYVEYHDTKETDFWHFFMRTQDLLKLICDDDAIKHVVHPYMTEASPDEFINTPVTTKRLPELRAAIATSVVSIHHSWAADARTVRDLDEYAQTLGLGLRQWQSIEIFVKWKAERKKPAFLGELDSGVIRKQVQRIEYELACVKRRIHVQGKVTT